MNMDELKQAAAAEAVRLIESGMVVGLGTGSTAAFAVAAVGERVKQGLDIVGIPTSERTRQQAESLGIRLGTLAEFPAVDVTIDGADEVELGSLYLVKGLGGALLREKIVASASKQLVIMVDASKLVERLGSKGPVPVEVVPFGWQSTEQALKKLGAVPQLRVTSGSEPYVTDGSHYILDCTFESIGDAAALEAAIARTVGVVESGLFVNLTSQVIVARAEGVEVLKPA